jgi:tetratricopeptide (TPR) repeat protein
MGAVFLAEQDRPVKRQVALKVIKPGMDTEQVVARFEAERQALAMMDHPNIARVFDAGGTDSGRPYFVMELADGIPINEYCDRERLSPQQRLELFVIVCQAIQHAHQKGIIHRDIKPSNVLVTVRDGKPVPKVIDFGVAKAIDQRLTERTLFTQLGALVGTPEYMSPEQADFSGGGIDTRSDICSLGVLLYELLTGTTPLGRVRLREAAFSEVLRRIREEEPPKPSTRLSDSGDRLATISAQRRTEPARLARLVRGDLDWIAMKALAKDRTRRYETATALAADVQRYLDGEPVEAGPPSALYRAGKFARKHRAALAAAGAFLGLLVVAAIVSMTLMLRALAAERLANHRWEGLLQAKNEADAAHAETRAALVRSEEARRRAEAAEKTAQSEADKAHAINHFLVEDLLTQAEPAQNAVEDRVTLLEVVDRAADKVGDRFAGQPELEDNLRRRIASIYHGLGSWEKAERQWRAVLEAARRRRGTESREALTATGMLAHILGHRGQIDAQLETSRSTYEGLTRILGPDHPETLASGNNLAQAYVTVGRPDEAVRLFEATLKAEESKPGPEKPDTRTRRGNLAVAYAAVGRTEEAIALLKAALQQGESTLDPDHPDTLMTRNKLARIYFNAGCPAEAAAQFEAAIKAMESRLGPDHPDTLASRADLAAAYHDAGRPAEGIALLEATLKRQEAKLDPDDPQTLMSRRNLAVSYLDVGRPAEAIPLLEATLKPMESKYGPDHPETLYAMAYLG